MVTTEIPFEPKPLPIRKPRIEKPIPRVEIATELPFQEKRTVRHESVRLGDSLDKKLLRPIDELIDLLPTRKPDDPRRETFDRLYTFMQKEGTQQLLSKALKDERHFVGIVDRLARLILIGEEHQDPCVKGFISDAVERNVSLLERTLDQDNDPKLIAQGLQIFTSAVEPDRIAAIGGGNERRVIDLVFAAFQRHFPSVKAALENRLDGFNYIPLLKKILDYGRPDFVSQSLKVLDEQVRQGQGLNLFNRLLEYRQDARYYEPAKPLLRTQLEVYGLDPDILLSAWETCIGTKEGYYESPGIVRQNLATIDALEKFNRETTKYLIEHDGILHFGRYPPEILIRQYEEDKLAEMLPIEARPYTAYIGVTNQDNNGASYHHLEVFRSLAKQLEEKFPGQSRIRVFEYASKLEGMHNINQLRKRFGRAFLGIINNHGNPFEIRTGENEDITLDDLRRPGANAVRLAFTDQATLILISCSTGKKVVDVSKYVGKEQEKAKKFAGQRGFAVTASKASGLHIIAPTVDTFGLNSVSIEKKPDNTLEFDVTFAEGKGATAAYYKGEEVKVT